MKRQPPAPDALPLINRNPATVNTAPLLTVNSVVVFCPLIETLWPPASRVHVFETTIDEEKLITPSQVNR